MNTMVTLVRRLPLAWCAAAVLALACGPPGWAQGEPLDGDVNRDGVIDILDIQGTVNMALGATDPNPQADVDQSEAVDVLDVQTITNSVLGVGGLQQRVRGNIDLGENAGAVAAITAVAISGDGQIVRQPVTLPNGVFELLLSVRNTWSLAFFAGEAGNESTAGLILFPIGEALSLSLPLPNLSRGNTLDLGTIPLFAVGQSEADLRTLLGETAEPLGFEDYNGNGAPDLLEEWLLPIELPEVAGLLGLSIDDEDAIEILAALAACAEARGLVQYSPDLSTFVNGLPRQLEPLLLCVPFELEAWVRRSVNVQSWMEPLLTQLVNALNAEIREEIEDWFADPDVPELRDLNGNGVPDHIEPAVCVLGGAIPGLLDSEICQLDANGDGIPDYAQDSGDGVPRLFSANPPAGDQDGDGVPDEQDRDANNNGVPDYAE